MPMACCDGETLAERSLVMSWLRDPVIDPIRDDPRYTAIFARLGLAL